VANFFYQLLTPNPIVFGTNFERFFAVSPPLSVSLPQGGERTSSRDEKTQTVNCCPEIPSPLVGEG